MMKRAIYIVCLLALSQITAYSQTRKELIDLGDQAFKKGNYGSAVYFYKKLFFGSAGKNDVTFPYEVISYGGSKKKSNDSKQINTSDETEINALNRLAESYRLLHDYKNAERYYSMAVKNKSLLFPDAKYYYALTLMNNSKYAEAEKIFDEYVAEGGGTQVPMAEIQKAGCVFAANDSSTIQGVTATELDSNFNKGTAALGLTYFTDNSVAFASARKGNVVADPKKEVDFYTTDFYIANANEEGNGWDEPQHLVGFINSNQNEGGGAMAVDRTTFYFTRWNPENPQECNIYVSKMFNRRWLEPFKIDGLNMEGFRSMQPCLSLDNTKLYFASDRPGGLGGLDIWVCKIDEDGNLGAPENLGAPINTIGDELSPYHHHQSSTLFFSSNGHSGFGGLDIYKTHWSQDDAAWSMPVNLGAPINSSTDDLHYIMDKNQVTGFFTSDRKHCTNCDSTQDIQPNCSRIYSFQKPDLHFTLSGYVYDQETEEIIPNALVTFKDVRGEAEPFFITTDEKGFYKTDLSQDQELFIKAQKVKYFADAGTVNTLGLTESADLEKDFFLRPIPTGEIEIPGIEYDFDRATLRPKSMEILDKLYDFLVLNDNLIVEIKSHTDCRGGDVYNQKLSQDRAQSCVDYLVTKGIKRTHIIPQGKGESEPIPGYECETIEKLKKSDPDKYEEMHQRNRRTAFRVVKEGDPTAPVLESNK
jgi:OOP family OmpA-OmpF porin